ncbi:MAG TPA: CDP-alcohol phosphatidyltransferase family protein [Actinomycetota bacterium]|nr:CDP-alcohol phosphatidyltransferase family protein [Actinomycetota bacterium]
MTQPTRPPAATLDRGLWTVPNVLSILRLASVPVFVWLFVSGRENAAVILYAAGAWTDFFDGVIARRFDQVSEIGKLLDPLADRILIIALVVALVARDALPLWLAIVIVARDVLLLSVFPILERKKVPRIAVNFTGKSATAALLFGLTSLAWSETTFVAEGVADEIGIAFTTLGAVLYWVAAALYAQAARDTVRALTVERG